MLSINKMELPTYKDDEDFLTVQTQLTKHIKALAADPVASLAKLSDQDKSVLENSETHNLLAAHSLAIAHLISKIDCGALKIDPDNPEIEKEPRSAAESLLQHQSRANCLF